ncbi:hypothetical protein NWQ33_00800 [Mycoplasmopsis cynos]|nr:hypothetical protein [Mycoplasmopsis cynos]
MVIHNHANFLVVTNKNLLLDVKWILHDFILIVQPTRGLDVGAIHNIQIF